ncbi:hypothetical protein WH52_12310 [Tenacibaculum holothuriorum]|uniref:Uncharacterized protein n=1 Tax=Tenacibaculum holothuriorum TaxID=1635173 RepID=A0A1Y2PBX7_9FLAO|nr:hypothetical protein [Tenacibaculum holothuriorum]OSY87239.1 hypothetical protein WH52_12310 [Tenacibaculum holothuriorum]
MAFESNLFINCPFDNEYKPILKAIVFSAVYLGFNPLLSETVNSADSRVSGIQNLIAQAQFSIHDLSRMESTKKNQLARFNMPFELGMDIGCKVYGEEKMRNKYLLILDKERYRYQRAISDLSGNDIEIHNNSPEVAIRKFRNWVRKIKNEQIDSANKIWRLYNEFNGDFYFIAQEYELSKEDIDEMPWEELCHHINEWLTSRENN